MSLCGPESSGSEKRIWIFVNNGDQLLGLLQKNKYFVETMAGSRREGPLKEASVPDNDSEVNKSHFGG